ncbi:MAG: hypothetical protein IJS52_06150, partial [Bacilli bacterium]|nr:hypothetical protein [Bacilli bacterium]
MASESAPDFTVFGFDFGPLIAHSILRFFWCLSTLSHPPHHVCNTPARVINRALPTSIFIGASLFETFYGYGDSSHVTNPSNGFRSVAALFAKNC